MLSDTQIVISTGTEFGKVKKTQTTWGKLSERLATHRQADKKAGGYFVGGYFRTGHRKEADLLAMTVLSLDIDKLEMPIGNVELALRMDIGNAFVAYSTYSHGIDGKSSVRVVLPLSREVTPDEYRQLAKAFGESMSLPLDECSFKPNQAMFLPTCPDLANTWSMIQDGPPVDVDQYLPTTLATSPTVTEDETGVDDLAAMVAQQPLDLTDEEVDNWLMAGPAQGLDYHDWLMRGAALHHQYRGSDVGFEKWMGWSSKSDKHDSKDMRMKWRSFGRSNRVVTFASVIFAVRKAGGFDAPEAADTFEVLLEEAEAIRTLEDYRDFKTRVIKMPPGLLHNDHRAMLAARIAKTFGKEQGITKGDIKKALAFRRLQREDECDVEIPAWLEDWVYCESTLEFVNTELDYAIKREGFNAKFDREPECEAAEMSASQYALTVAKIQTVVDTMYWPGADLFFEYEGKKMLNRYRDRGVPVVKEDPHGVVGRFLKHVELTLPDQADREILLDWLCFICQNPGKRINWALLLQGAQGSGKTYFVNVLQRVLGSNVSNLDTQAIAGRFTGWAHGSVAMAIEEIRIHGTNKYEILDRMKPFLTNDTISIEEKGRDHRTVPNFTSYFLLTNHLDAIPLGGGDRRYCVLYSKWQSEDQLFDELGGRSGAEKYFDALFGDLEHDDRVGALAYYLKTRKHSDGFSPRGRAPETKARQRMINLAISPERQILEDAISEHECPVINEHILDLTWLNELCKKVDTELPKNRAITAILLEMGYEQYEKRKIKISKTRRNHYIWLGRGSNTSFAPQVVRDFHDGPDFVQS